MFPVLPEEFPRFDDVVENRHCRIVIRAFHVAEARRAMWATQVTYLRSRPVVIFAQYVLTYVAKGEGAQRVAATSSRKRSRPLRSCSREVAKLIRM